MADPDPPPSGASESQEAKALREKVEAARARYAQKQAPATQTSAGSLAMRFGGEFGSAVLVGAGLGYGVDYWVHTGPWGLIIGLAAGFTAGVVNMVRAARAYAAKNPVDPKASSIPDDAED